MKMEKKTHPHHAKHPLCNASRHTMRGITWAFAILITLAACSAKDVHIIDTDGTDADADKLLIVDCLLPGRIQKLGATVYVTPRRPAKLSAKDCKKRGGEYTAYREANTASALKVWLSAAQKGDKIAQTYVGEIYEKGRGLQPDYKLAAQWYKKAADQGHSRAKLNLGYLFEKGLGVNKDVAVALQLYREASGLGDTSIEYKASENFDPQELHSNVARGLKHDLEKERKRLVDLRYQVTNKSQKLQDQQRLITQQKTALTAQKKKIASERQKANIDRTKLRSLENVLVQRRNQLQNQQVQTAQLKKQLELSRTQLATVENTELKIAVAGPSIQLINPTLLAVRNVGIPKVNINPQIKTREIIGQINAPAGIKRFLINNQPTKLNNKGIFKYLAQISQNNTDMRLIAIDQQGKRAALDFQFIQSNAPNTSPLPPATILNAAKPAGGFGRFYALVIGNDDYTYLRKLNTAVNDAKMVSSILAQRYGFRTTTLINASRFTILAALTRLSKKLATNDNLLVYYAGHGALKNDTGYWIPVDAQRTNPKKWISNEAITGIINAMNVKRVLVVADSCYSGTLTRSSAIAQINTSGSTTSRTAILRTLAKSRARTALVSGGLKPVNDTGENVKHSVFANAFIKVLQQNNRIIEGQRLHREIKARMAISPIAIELGQIPEYAPIRYAGHESGEFFLLPQGPAGQAAIQKFIVVTQG